MGWFLAVAAFLIQILCCVYARTKLVRLLVTAAVTVLTLIAGLSGGFWGFAGGAVLLWGEGKIFFAVILAWVIYKIAVFTKK